MTEVEATLWGAIIGGGIGIVSAFFGYLWNRRVTRESNKITEFNKAATAFYAAFLDEIIFLEETKPEDVPIKLIERTTKANMLEQKSIDMSHRKAMIMFRPYIDKSDLVGFDTAWEAYHNWTLPQYSKRAHEEKNYFKTHLNDLLKYAKPK